MASAMVSAQGAEASSERGGGSQLDLPSSFYFLKVIAVQIEPPSAWCMTHYSQPQHFCSGKQKGLSLFAIELGARSHPSFAYLLHPLISFARWAHRGELAATPY